MRYIKEFLLAFYDDMGCFDEMRFDAWDIEKLKLSLQRIANTRESAGDYVRLYALFEDGTRGEYTFDPNGLEKQQK